MAHGLHRVGVEQSTLLPGRCLPISAMGSMVPISLLAAMMEIRMVSGRMAFSTSAGSHQPAVSSTGR